MSKSFINVWVHFVTSEMIFSNDLGAVGLLEMQLVAPNISDFVEQIKTGLVL